MNLREAQLCVDCEWLYADSTICPRCGSHVAFPVARAMNHSVSVVARFAAPRRLPAAVARPALVRPAFAG